MRNLFLGIAAVTMMVPGAAMADDAATADVAAKLAYPQTKKQDIVEEQFGVKVADPYRWLEDDVRVNPEVAKWVEAQNAVSLL
jgi:prolyl oligopeptidase